MVERTVNPASKEGECFYCKIALTIPVGNLKEADRTIDHVVPKGMGGHDVALNRVWCCFLCNQGKGSTLPARIHLDALGIRVWVDGMGKTQVRRTTLQEWQREAENPEDFSETRVRQDGIHALERRFGPGAHKHTKKQTKSPNEASEGRYERRRKHKTTAEIMKGLYWDDEDTN